MGSSGIGLEGRRNGNKVALFPLSSFLASAIVSVALELPFDSTIRFKKEIATPPSRQAVRRALFYLAASAIMFGMMAFFAKLATGRLSGAQVATVRFLIGIVPVLLIPKIRRASMTFQRVDLLFYRGFFGGIAVLLYFTAIAHIPVGVATLLNYTTPMFSGIAAAVFIGEPLRPRVVAPLLIAFSGVWLVVTSHLTPHEVLGFGPWEVMGLISAFCSALAVTSIRAARRTEGSWSIYASFTVFGLLAALPFCIRTWKTPTAAEWFALAGVGVFAMAAQLAMTHSFKWIETVVAGIVSQLAVIVAMILGALWLHEVITPVRMLGSALTIGGVVIVAAMTTGAKR